MADIAAAPERTLPHSLELFVDLVTPELQRRGLTPESYEPGTLRDRLGLRRPERVVPV